MHNLTTWKSLFTMTPIQKSSWMANSLNSSSLIYSKSCLEYHLNKVASNATSDLPYPSRPEHRRLTGQCRAMMLNALPHPGSRQSCMLHRSQKRNSYTADDAKLIYPSAQNKHAATSQFLLFLPETVNTSNASLPSTVIKQTSSIPQLVFRSVREDEPIRAQVTLMGYEDIDGNIRGNTNASDVIQVEGFLREPEIPHVIIIVVWNRKTGVTVYYPRSPDMKSKHRIATNVSTQRLQHYKLFQGPTMSPLTRTTAPSCAHHNSWHWWSGHCAWEREPQNSDEGPINGSFSPGSQTGGDGHHNQGIHCSSGITKV